MVGGGAMGSALKGCWHHHDVTMIDPIQDGCVRSIADLPAGYTPDVIVLAVKPQIMAQVLPDYVAAFSSIDCVWVSVAAGLPIAFYKQFIPSDRFVRCMPNLPVLYQEGAIGLFSDCKADVNAIIDPLFTCAGQVVWLDDESEMHALTALSGSGPAYVYLMVECLAKAGAELGLSKETATLLARQTVIGAAEMIKQDARDAHVLREQVTSPKGTTEAALAVLMHDNRLEHLLTKAVEAALYRSRELSDERL